jgi:aspartate/methionine/tyrosine aminotransferase
MFTFRPFKHLQYINDLRSRLPQPLQFTLSDACAQSLQLSQLLALGDQQQIAKLSLGYSPIAGSEPLRQAIATLHQQSLPTSVNPLTADNVTVFCGAQEALFCTFNSLLSVGDEVIALTPHYPSLVDIPQQLGATVKTVELHYEQQWQFTLEDVKALISNKTRILMLNSPHNPTGAVIPAQLVKELIILARQHGIYIVSDEVSVWSDFAKKNIAHPILSYEKTIAIGVMSKSFGLPGVRIGWVVAHDKQRLQRLRDIRGYLSICGSSTDEYLATVALKNYKTILSRNNQIIKSNVEQFSQFIAQSDGRFEWVVPQGGILTIVKSNLDIPIYQLAEKLAMQKRLLILPGDLFGLNGNYFRLGFGRSDFSQALEQFSF